MSNTLVRELEKSSVYIPSFRSTWREARDNRGKYNTRHGGPEHYSSSKRLHPEAPVFHASPETQRQAEIKLLEKVLPASISTTAGGPSTINFDPGTGPAATRPGLPARTSSTFSYASVLMRPAPSTRSTSYSSTGEGADTSTSASAGSSAKNSPSMKEKNPVPGSSKTKYVPGYTVPPKGPACGHGRDARAAEGGLESR